MIGSTRTVRGTAVALSAAVVLSACSEGSRLVAPDVETRVQLDTPALRDAKAAAGIAPCPPDTAAGSGERVGDRAGSDLPDLTLACLGGGDPVTLSSLEGPAVISLWASWCTSCEDELPLFERLSRQGPAELSVYGIDYQDVQPGGALTMARRTGVTYPQMADPGGSLADHFPILGLPGIIFLDSRGRSTFKPTLVASYADLAGLVEQHTGVTVTRQ